MNRYTASRLQYASTKAKQLEAEFWDELADDIELSEKLAKALATELSQFTRAGEFG